MTNTFLSILICFLTCITIGFRALNSPLLRKSYMISMLLGNIIATDENEQHFWDPWYQYMGGRYDYFSTTLKNRAIIGHYLVAMEHNEENVSLVTSSFYYSF